MDEIPESLVDGFREEARELLADMESALLELEARPGDLEEIARAFRALHTIKGNAAIFGFTEIEQLAHAIEHVFDLLRKERMAFSQEIVGLTLAAKDRLLALLRPGEDSAAERHLREQMQERIVLLLRDQPAWDSADRAGDGAADAAPGAAHAPPAAARTWRIEVRPHAALLAQGTDPVVVFEELRGFGACQVAARFDEVPSLEEMDPEQCYLSWEIILTTERGEEALRDALLFLGGPAAVRIAPAGAAGPLPPSGRTRDVRPAAEPGGGPAAGRGQVPRPASEISSTLRVEAGKLDKLVNLVGELVTVQARLSRLADGRGDAELLGVAEEVERLTAELRDHTLNVRMVPIGPAFGKFRRHVRDLAFEIGREVELVTEGGDTELDKSVIDRLADPIVHLLRNGVDHGIEPPEVRERAGKPRRGTVRLSASYSGANVLIRVEDDGAGIDAEAVRRRAIERGLLSANEGRSEREVFALMFLPGFSTSRRVTTVSGRGVGLDVVKRAVEALRGSVRIESRRGEGTVFEVRLPLTLAIIEGLDVMVGSEHFILPLGVVNECVELVHHEGERAGAGRLAEIRGEQVPYVRLRDWFAAPGERPAREQIVVTETEGWRVGLVVDAVVGEQQTVIKPLGPLFRGMRGLAGATILGDGAVALILDVGQLVRGVERAQAGPAGAPEAQC